MKKLIFCCAISALFGGGVAAWLAENHTQLISSSNAQELGSANGTVPLATASLPANPSLTPEELTNIRVYDGANRGVVNVLTKTVSHDRFFMLATPAEGAGSGSVLD